MGVIPNSIWHNHIFTYKAIRYCSFGFQMTSQPRAPSKFICLHYEFFYISYVGRYNLTIWLQCMSLKTLKFAFYKWLTDSSQVE
jgi:hypothetical protein